MTRRQATRGPAAHGAGTRARGTRRRATWLAAALAGWVLATGPGCAQNHAASDPRASDVNGTPPAATAARDTVRGVIAVVGSEPAVMVALRPAGGGPELFLEGDAVRALRRLSGVEVWAEGQGVPERRRFTVRRFAVRAVEGTPAVDGVLVAEEGGLFLVPRDGERVRIPDPPPALRARTGAWVWIAGRRAGDVEAYGIIAEADG